MTYTIYSLKTGVCYGRYDRETAAEAITAAAADAKLTAPFVGNLYAEEDADSHGAAWDYLQRFIPINSSSAV